MNTKKVISRMLTLALAFVMVFTGIGIGDFGTDTAYAAAPSATVVGGELKASIDQKDSRDQYTYIIKPNADTNELTITLDYVFSEEDLIHDYGLGGNDYKKIKATFSQDKKTVTFSIENMEIATTDLVSYYLSEQNTYDGWKDQTYYGVYAYTEDVTIYFFIEVNDSKIDAPTLKAAIEKAPEADEGKYYTSEDRYNGKKVSTKGFWVEMQEALTAAKALFTDDTMSTLKEGVSAAAITTAYNKLQDSIAALIPAGQANTTILYEAMQNAPTIDAGYPCNQENLTAFQTKKTEAQSLLSSLFSSGTATSANLVSAQNSIDEAAAALTASYADGKLDAVITTQAEFAAFMKQAKTNYKGVLQNDLNLSEYTPEYSFTGILDGNGYAVIADSTYKGLVTNNEGTIKNLRVKGVARTSVAAICRTNKGLIDSCANEADFSNYEAAYYGKDRGAICDTNDTTGIIRNCYNTGKLTGMYVGGISGENYGLIENCFNAGIIDAESEAGGIVWRNRNDFSKLTNALNAKSGTIKDCYNFNVMHHANGWNGFYGSYIEKNLGPICGDNEKALVNISENLKQIENEGTVENSLYLDTIVTNKPNGGSISIELSDIYTAKRAKFQSEGAGTKAGTAIAGWTEKDSENSIFAYDTDYYVFYDKSNDRFIAVTFSADATSNLIDAANPSDKSEKCTSAAGDEKDFYLVEIPTGSTKVQFKNTVKIIDYANGYTNKYVRAYQLLDHAGVTSGAELSRKFVGTALKSSDIENVLNKVKTICGSDNDTITFVTEMLAGIDNEKQAAGGESEKKISVEFRLVGATKSTSGNYDLGAKPPVKDSQYVTWIATKSYSVSDGSTVGDLLKLAIKESGMSSQGQEANYVSGMYAPTILGNYYLGEFTNGKRSGWMYSVNGKHPNVGLNGYILKDGDSVIWHYINDYSYECSDWFNDAEYPNLGDASTWDPWLKVADVNPTKNTPTVGVAAEETKDVESDKTASTTTSPTDVKVSEKTNADGTKKSVATVTVSAENQKEILAQAKSNKSKEIILQVSKDAVKDATKADVQLDKSFIESVLKDTDAKLTVKTPFGDKTYTQDELKALAAAAAGKTVSLEIVKSEKTDEELKAEQLEKAVAAVSKASIKARSSKTGKGNVKIVFKPDTKTQNFINEMKDMGYAVKYRFYRSTKKSSGYKAMLTKTSKTYTNTSGKKGTKYYYKVQVRVYDENGKCVAKTALKQCKYASRTWTK